MEKIFYLRLLYTNMSLSNKRVLIVEDDEDIRNIVGEILENEGYEVAGCNYTLETC